MVEKQEEFEECQERLEKANREIDSLRKENECMSLDLDKAELLLEDYY